MPKSSKKDALPSFEEAMDELDGIVQAMEGDRLSLAELIEQYARGTKLEKICRKQLAVAKQRVETITAAADGGGDLEVAPFDPAEAPTADGGEAKTETRRSGAKQKSKQEAEENDDEIRLF